MQWNNNTAGPQVNMLCFPCQCCLQDCRVGVEPSIFSKVAFGNPDRRKTVQICIFVLSKTSRYLSPLKGASLLEKKIRPKSIPPPLLGVCYRCHNILQNRSHFLIDDEIFPVACNVHALRVWSTGAHTAVSAAIDMERYMFMCVRRKDDLNLLGTLLWQEEEFLQLQVCKDMPPRSKCLHSSCLGHLNID